MNAMLKYQRNFCDLEEGSNLSDAGLKKEHLMKTTCRSMEALLNK